MRILYDSKSLVYKRPFGTLTEGEKCEISIDIPKHCKTKEVFIEFFKEQEKAFEFALLDKMEIDENYERYSGSFSITAPDLYFYRFFIKTQESDFPLYKEGFCDTNIHKGDFWQLTCTPREFSVPREFFGRVMYQIFPDRFYKKGETDLKGKLQPFYVHKSQKDIPDFRPNENGEVLNCDFFGGNLKGIKEKLPYLKKLGVSVIYLNPIFKAYSNHRYDTADYKKIDEMLGTEDDFKSLCKRAHRLGIKIILDGVFSHTGSRSVYFESAVSDENSPYREWFDFKSYPDSYTSWWGIKTLPCVNELSKSFQNFIYGDDDSVIAHWLSLGADGFRLDVADELPDEFIAGLRKRLKEINPKALLIGEVWEDASNKISYDKRRRYFSSGELDSVMNYPFRNAILDFVLGNDNGENFRKTVLTICENYPKDVLNVLMNFLSTHDTQRALTVLSGQKPPETKEERAEFKLSESQRPFAEKRLIAAAFMQFILPGMPSVYYGDEIGTQGFEDPFCRSFFDWEKEKTSHIRAFFERLSRLRNRSDALKTGRTDVEYIAPSVVKIIRESGRERAEALINCSQENFSIEKKTKIIFSQNCEVDKDIKIKPYGFVLFKN